MKKIIISIYLILIATFAVLAYLFSMVLDESRIYNKWSLEYYLLTPEIIKKLPLKGLDTAEYYYSSADGNKPTIYQVQFAIEASEEEIVNVLTEYFIAQKFTQSEKEYFEISSYKNSNCDVSVEYIDGDKIKITILERFETANDKKDGPSSTNTLSSDKQFNSLLQKIEYLQQYVTFRRAYYELDFAIFFQNNSEGLVPGPSEWDIRLVASIPEADIKEWTKGLEPIESVALETEWIKELPGPIDRSGISAWFKKGSKVVGVDNANHIIVYRNIAR